MSNEQLAEQVKNGVNTPESALQLWENVRRLAYTKISKYRQFLEEEDLTQEAFLAVYDAAAGYDQTAGVPFANYYMIHLKNRFIEYAAGQSALHVPAWKREKANRYRKLKEALENEGRQLQAVTGKDLEEMADLEAALNARTIRSLDSPIDSGDADGDTLADLTAGTENPIESTQERLEREELARALWGEVEALPEEQGHVIREIYQNQKTVPQIARETGRDEKRVKQDSRTGLARLQRYDVRNRLRPYLPDSFLPEEFGSMAYSTGSQWLSTPERIVMKLHDRE